MKKLLLFSIMIVFLFANSGKQLAIKLHINPSSKAIKQWERIFKKKKKQKKYGIDKLSDSEKEVLKKYLINHAADSDQPESAGF